MFDIRPSRPVNAPTANVNRRAPLVRILAASVLSLLTPACNGTGACDGYSDLLGKRYCEDGFDQAECQDWNDRDVNGASWNFYEGQTCEERGCPSGTSC